MGRHDLRPGAHHDRKREDGEQGRHEISSAIAPPISFAPRTSSKTIMIAAPIRLSHTA
jgi:hypothetical protein